MADDFGCSFAAIFWSVEANHFFKEMVDFLHFVEGYLVTLAVVWDWIFDDGQVELAIIDGAADWVLFDGWCWLGRSWVIVGWVILLFGCYSFYVLLVGWLVNFMFMRGGIGGTVDHFFFAYLRERSYNLTVIWFSVLLV
jgi:hypothetical protein